MAYNKLIFYFFIMLIGSKVYAQSNRVQIATFDYHEVPLRSVLEDIQRKTGINFVFQDQLIDSKKVTYHSENAEAKDAIKQLLSRQKLAYKTFDKDCIVIYDNIVPEKKEYVKIILKKSEPMDTSAVISEPKIISSKILEYPSAAIKDKKEGNVVLKVFISKDGKGLKSFIEKSQEVLCLILRQWLICTRLNLCLRKLTENQ